MNPRRDKRTTATKHDKEAGFRVTKRSRFCTALLSRLAKQRQADLAQKAASGPTAGPTLDIWSLGVSTCGGTWHHAKQ